MPEYIPPEEAKKLIKVGRAAKELAFGVIGYKAELTFENLKEMERVINRVYPAGHQAMPTTFIPFGVHLGEVLIKHIPGAKWDFEEMESLFDLKVTATGANGARAVVKPIKRIAKFWSDRTDTIFGFAEMIRDLANGTLEPREEGKWVKRDNGTQIRMFGMSPNPTEEDKEYLQMKMGKVVNMETWNKHKDR